MWDEMWQGWALPVAWELLWLELLCLLGMEQMLLLGIWWLLAALPLDCCRESPSCKWNALPQNYMSASLFTICFPQRRDLVWECPVSEVVFARVGQQLMVGWQTGNLMGGRFSQIGIFSDFLVKVFVCAFFWFEFCYGETSNTMSECKYQDGPQKGLS